MKRKNLLTLALLFLCFSPQAQEKQATNPSQALTLINNTTIPLIMVCGTTTHPGYLQHPFIDPTKDETKKFQVNTGLFLNSTESVTCAVFKVNSPTPVPHDFIQAFSFTLVPGVFGEQVKIKTYVEQISSLEITTDYKLDTEGNLTLTLSPAFAPKPGATYLPSQLGPPPK